MKNRVLFVGLLLAACWGAVAQNKTLGVGVATPNPNAALHVESPTGNQGFILPRLTTAQRTASGFMGALGAADNGLLVYDLDLNAIYIWDGSAWTGAQLDLPYVDTISSAPNNSNLIRLVYAGSAVENVGVAQFENLNPNNGFAAVFGRTNSATNGAADFVVNNAANNNDAIGASTNGIGTAGRFTIANPASFANAVYAQTNGDSTAAAVFGENIGNGMGIHGVSNGSRFASAAVYGEHKGTGDAAGVFRISNAASTYSALFGETNGSGPAVFGNQLGTGRGGQFQITNVSNTNTSLRSYTAGLGFSGFFTINNASSTSDGLYSTTNGTGTAIKGENTSTSNASAGMFINTQSTNSYPALLSTTNGTGAALQAETSSGFSALYAKRDGPGNGNAALFDITDGSNLYPTVQANTVGTGNAGSFTINNSINSTSALWALTNGTGSAISGDNTSSGDVIFINKTGASGSAGNFMVSNASNTASAIYALTSSPNGYAVGANHTANGNAMMIQNGGVKLSTATLSTTSIATRAAAYYVTGSGPFTFTGITPAVTEGEIFYFYNSNIVSINVEGISIPASTGKTIIYLGGGFREF